MLAGPLFTREWLTLPRRPRHYLLRGIYVGLFFVLLWTAYQATIGFERAPRIGEIARFNAVAFELFSYTQLALVLFAGALYGTSAVSIEKDRRTFVLLLVTRLSDGEIVAGKFAAALLQVGILFTGMIPVFFLMPLFGGVSYLQVVEVLLATAGSALVALALGVLIGIWREKTFQALALTLLGLALSLLLVETLAVTMGDRPFRGETIADWAATLSPTRAIAATLAMDPSRPKSFLPGGVHLALSVLLTVLYLLIAIMGLRRWNPRGEAPEPRETPERMDAHSASRPHREVWENPVLWREIRTRAYGARPIVIKLAYVLIAGLLGAGLVWAPPQTDAGSLAFSLARTLVPISILSLLLINAQSLAAITSERDLKSLDLLLVTDVSPREFVFGKLAGIFYNAKEMLLVPLGLLGFFLARGWVDEIGLIEGVLVFLMIAVFTAVLGMHAGLRHPTTKGAIGNSLGTMFLLFVGVLICLYLIVISGDFEAQWASFVLFIILGSIGLWISLGANHPSGAISLTAAVMPVATFYAILAFVVGDRFAPFAVTTAVYGFAVVAMLIPMLSEFDVATGRTNVEGD